MTLREVLAQLAARRDDYARLRAQVDAAALVGEVLELLERVDGAETVVGRDLDTEEAAKVLSCNPRTVERLCREERLPGAYKTSANPLRPQTFKDGRQRPRAGVSGEWRIPAAALEAYRAARARNGKEAA